MESPKTDTRLEQLHIKTKEADTIRVLIVEDDPGVAKAIQRILKHIDYDSYIVYHINDIGLVIGTYQPNIITMDLDLPGFNGFDAIDFIRSACETNHIPILVISGLPLDELKLSVIKGANDLLQKPFDNAELLKKIKQLT